jgi:hypothetical protein
LWTLVPPFTWLHNLRTIFGHPTYNVRAFSPALCLAHPPPWPPLRNECCRRARKSAAEYFTLVSLCVERTYKLSCRTAGRARSQLRALHLAALYMYEDPSYAWLEKGGCAANIREAIGLSNNKQCRGIEKRSNRGLHCVGGRTGSNCT